MTDKSVAYRTGVVSVSVFLKLALSARSDTTSSGPTWQQNNPTRRLQHESRRRRRRRARPRPRERYVIYQANAGFGNRLQSFQIALFFAMESNRTLLVPPFTEKHNAGKNVTFSHYFLPIDPHVASVIEVSDSDYKKVIATSWSEKIPVHPHECKRNNKDLIDWARHSNADVLFYHDSYGYWESMFEDSHPFMFMLDNIHIRPQIIKAARTLRSHLPCPYEAMHLRLGDRQGLALVNCSERGLSWKTMSDFGCNEVQFIDEVALRTFPDNVNVYVATNRPTDIRMKILREQMIQRNISLWTFDDFPADLLRKIIADGFETYSAELQGPREGVLISLIEQILVIDANNYLPSFPSSWDSYVIDKRVRKAYKNALQQFDLMREQVARRFCGI